MPRHTPHALRNSCIFPSIMRAHARTRGNPANPPFAAPTLGGAAVPNRQNRPKWAEIRRSPQRETWFLAGARSFANPGRRVRRGEDRGGHRRDQHLLDAARTGLDATLWRQRSRDAGCLINIVRSTVPRCLTPIQREAFHLGTPPPRW